MLYNAAMNNLFGEGPSAAKGGAAYSAAVCLYIVVSLIISSIVQGAGISDDGAAYLYCLCSPVALAVFMALCGTLLKCPVRTTFRAGCSPKYYILALLALFGLIFAVSPLNSLIFSFMQDMGYSSASLPSMEGWGMLGSLIVLAVLPAVLEELLFRGVMLDNLNRSSGTWSAVFLTALAFCLYHGSAAQTVYQFVCGCVFALIAARSGSVLPSMLAHFLNNALIVVANGLSLVDADGNFAMPDWAFVVLAVAGGICLIVSLVMLAVDKKRHVARIKGNVSPFFVWGGAGLFVMALAWVLSLVQL